MPDRISLRPIGWVRNERTAPIDDDWDSIESQIELDLEWIADSALAGLESFSHVTVIFYFDRVEARSVVTAARHPRGKKEWPLAGIFAQRGKNRPNRLGVTTCELLSVEPAYIKVRGLDAIDQTPVLDIKPFMTGFAPRGAIREPDWSKEIMQRYWEDPS